ncbi:AMP-binding domain containing protein [Babesia caballi]|uniref:AMP-binding domain containing protein n=1 Tax=Babesia caballi TaxID=5871 RepID=A0AAV4LT39_BABCB|nr:AMP-binding domain containing protein [Babesia caballi]
MACNFVIHEPKTLKEALELLDVLHKSVGGAIRGVQKVFNKTLSNGTAAFSNLQSALYHASNLRARIVGYATASNYRSYGKLKNSGDDEECGSEIIAILRSLLPKLIETLKFLLKEVKINIDDGWGMQTCNGRMPSAFISNKKDLHKWLTSQHPTVGSPLPGGYEAYKLMGSTGDSLSASLVTLLKDQNSGLYQLNKDISKINVTREVREKNHNKQKILRGSAQPSPPSQYQTTTNDGMVYQPEQPPAEDQPAQNTGYSSTATIGGAVGATGLVGGGAAVYFLNIGGIRTLIAG